MNKLTFFFSLLLVNFCHAQISTKFYTVPNVNVLGVGVRESTDGDLFLLLDTYCYTPGSIVIEGCPRGYHLFRLDANHDTIWTYPINGNLYPSLDGLSIQPQNNKIKIFGSSGPESGECNGNYIFASLYSGLTWSTVHNLDFNGNYLDSAKFSVDNCHMVYRLARTLPGNRTLLGTQYYERGEQGPVTYAETRYFVLDSADNIQESYTYPNQYYGGAETAEIDSTHTLLVSYNFNNSHYEFVKIDDKGMEEWTKPYQGVPIRYLQNIQKLHSGDFIIRAVYYDNDIRSNVLNRYDADGNLVWSKEFVGTNGETAVGEMDNGTLLYGESLLNGSSIDILLRTLTPAGDSINAKWYTVSPGVDNIRAIIPQGDSFFLMGDAFGNLDSTYGPSRAFLLFDKPAVNSVKVPVKEKPYTVYPNPSLGMLYLQPSLPYTAIKSIVFYDCVGHNALTLYNNYERIDISNLNTGVYQMQVTNVENEVSIYKVIKI